METTASQAFIFLITIYGGMLSGLIYDIYRAIRKLIKGGRWVTAILDVMFVLTLGVVVTLVLYIANSGELRLYTFIGLALGFALYMAGLSPFILFLSRKIKQIIKCRKGNTK